MATSNGNNNLNAGPRPGIPRPRFDSLFNIITRRIRAANTIFADRVKLDLRQRDDEHWSFLKKPYLLVIPLQTQKPKVDDMGDMISSRSVLLVAQFDGKGSEGDYVAAVDIETAEKQLIYVLCNWQPPTDSPISSFKPTQYTGMRIAGTREPAVKVIYMYAFIEQIIVPEIAPTFPGEDEPEQLILDNININVNDPTCAACPCIPEVPPMPPYVSVTGGGCPEAKPVDPCEPSPCPPILDEQNQ